MQAWNKPEIPEVPGSSTAPLIFDTASQTLVEAGPDDIAGLYVCGITPYDATHLGHASTYLAFDTLQRVWLDAGFSVHYVQNVTDVDDPLLERATRTGVDWRDLASEQIALFRSDMSSLRVIPPGDFVAVSDVVEEIAEAVSVLLERGIAYRVETVDSEADDIYFDVAAAEAIGPWFLGSESNFDRETMLALFAQRGGDPDRPGKRDRLDALLWRSARENEPSWPSPVGPGRPGWHIECSVIALKHLGTNFTVQGGGSDLIFPHHELSAGHASALSGQPLARAYSHTGMVAYQGEKMSKSLGNLVLVSRLVERGSDPSAVRLALLAHHYRSDWEWMDTDLSEAQARLSRWRERVSTVNASLVIATETETESGAAVVEELRAALRQDLNTPLALEILDSWFREERSADSTAVVAAAVDALLGVPLN